MMSTWSKITIGNLQMLSKLQSQSSVIVSCRFYSTSSPPTWVGIPEFLRGIANRVEAHVGKIVAEQSGLLVACMLRLKKLEIPCKHNAGKLILQHVHKYRLGLWRPRADLVKV